MIVYVVIFLLVIFMSFLMALRSMKDYQVIPQTSKLEYGLFLIRQPQAFNLTFLEILHQAMLKEGLTASFERLFRGGESALTVYGSKKMLDQFKTDLNLLELEDYINNFDSRNSLLWEVGTKKDGRSDNNSFENIFQDFPVLDREDQFFWQVVFQARKENKDRSFQTQIRAVVYAKNSQTRKNLAPSLQNLAAGKLTKVPKPFSSDQIMTFYKLRSLSKDTSGPLVNAGGLLSLLRVS